MVSDSILFPFGNSGGSFVGTDEIGIPLTTFAVFVATLSVVAVDDDFLRSTHGFSRVLLLSLLVVIRRRSRVIRGC